MGRFYEAQQSKFVDNFIYEPNYNLMNAVVNKEQTGFDKAKADNADLLNQLKYKYIEESAADRANAERIRQEYANKVDAVTNKIRDTTKNWRDARPEIDNLKKDLAENFATGDISKLQKSRELFDKHKKDLESIKDADTKTAAEKYWFDKWQKENPNGSVNKLFGADETYDKIDHAGNFLTKLKATHDPESIQTAFANPGQPFMFKGKDGKTERSKGSVQQMFQDYLASINAEPQLLQRQNFGLENYYEKDGKTFIPFNDDRSALKKTFNYVGDMGRVLKTTQDRDVDVNPIYLAQMKIDADKAAVAKGRADKKQDEMDLISADREHNRFHNDTAVGKLGVQKGKEIISNTFKLTGTDEQKAAQLEVIRTKGTDAQKLKLKQLEFDVNSSQVKGENGFAQHYNPGIASALKAEMNSPRGLEYAKKAPVIIDFGEQEGLSHWSNKALKDPKYIGTTMNNMLAGKETNNIGQKNNNFTPDDLQLEEGSLSPMRVYNPKKEKFVTGMVGIYTYTNKDGNKVSVEGTILDADTQINVNTGELVKGYKD